jgi:hypothetical protein
MHLPKHPQDANEFRTIFKGQRSTNPSSTNRNSNQSRKFVQTDGDKVQGKTQRKGKSRIWSSTVKRKGEGFQGRVSNDTNLFWIILNQEITLRGWLGFYNG